MIIWHGFREIFAEVRPYRVTGAFILALYYFLYLVKGMEGKTGG